MNEEALQEDHAWIIQWRYDSSPKRIFPIRYVLSWKSLKFAPRRHREWLYHAKNKNDASKHDLETVIRLYQMMDKTYKRPKVSDYDGRRRLFRFFNVITKEEIYPETLDL